MSTAAAAAATGESEATLQKKKKKPKPKLEVGVGQSQCSHASEPLPAAPFLQTPAQSPAPGTPIPQEAAAAAMRKDRKIREEKGEEEAPKPNLEEGEEEARMASMKKKQSRKERKHAEIMPSSPSASAAKAPILQQEEKVTRKRKRRMEQEPSGNSPPSPLHPGDACNPSLQSPAPEILTLAEAAAMMRKRNMHKEHKVDALPFAPNHPTLEEQGKEKKKKKKKERKRVEQILLSPSTSAAAETPIQEQEVNVIKKQKRRRGQEPSGKSQEPSDNLPLPLHPGHVSEPLLAASLLQSPAPEILTLEEAAAMMRRRKMPKEQQVDALLFAPNPTLKEHGEEAMMATKKKKKRKCVEQILSSPFTFVAAETPIQEQEVKVIQKQKQRRGLEPSSKLDSRSGNSCQPGHASKPLLAAPILQSPAPEIITLGEAAAAVAMGKRKMRKEQKVAALSFAQNPTLEEEQVEEAMTAMTKKERKPVEQILSSPTSIAAETPIQEQEVNVIKKQKRRRGQEPSGKSHEPSDNLPLVLHPGHVSEPLLAASLLQSPAPEILTLEEAAAMMRRRKMPKEQKVDALLFAPNPTLKEHGEEAMMATKKKKKRKCGEQILSSPFTSVAAETPIQEQEVKVTKKRKQRRGLEPSGKLDSRSGNSCHPGHASKPLLAAPILQSPAPEIITLGEAAAAVATGKRKMRKEQKVAALSFAQNPTLEEEQGEEAMTAMTKKERKPVEQILASPTSIAAETPIQEQEVNVIKKQKRRRGQEPSGKSHEPSDNLPLVLHPGHVSEPLIAASLLQSPAPEILTLEEAAVMMRRRKMRKEQKVDVLPSAQNPTLVDHGEEAMMETKKKKKCKCVEQIFSSPSTSVAAETPIQEQEVKVTKKQRHRRKQEPSGKSDSPSSKSPLPLHPGHASKPILAAPFLQSPAPEILTLGDAGVAVTTGKRKMRKEQKVAALSFAQNPTLEEQQGEEAMTATTRKERKRVEQILSSPTFVAAETPVQEQEVKVTQKQKQGRGQEPSSKSTLPLDPGQSRCVQSQGAKTPPEQEGENDGFKGIKKSNGKKPPVRVLSNRELIQEARKQPQPLPEGFVPFSNFVASCTEQNADHSSPYSAFFDQFRYNPVLEDRKPPLPRTPDRLARLPPRGHSSFESSQLAANEASRPDTTLASKTKQQDSGSGSKAFKANNSLESKSKNKDSGSGSTSGSQKKQDVKEKTTPEKKTRIRKPRPVFSTAEKRSDKYLRVPLDQLVAPPCSPHNLLQEKYASDPWKVILICMFLNLTQGIQVKRILEGFFERYPDPWSAIDADPDKMAEYLSPLGLQHVRTRNIKKLSKQYVGNEWTHITQLCGVGKYAADAYAIFCAGRAREVVPDDHKLVDYWNYVCFELPMTQMD